MVEGLLGGTDIVVIALLLLILFGGSRIPKLARSLGETKREFKKGQSGSGDQKSEPGKDPSA